MKIFENLKVCVVLGSLLLVACAVDNPSKNNEVAVDTIIFSENPEPVKGKLDVYQTIARATKYNVDAAAEQLRRKIYNQNPNLTPQEIVEEIASSDVSGQSRLFAASRLLEFATIYAMANLEIEPQVMSDYLYQKSAMHLTGAAIKVHQNAWFASRKLKEVARLIRAEKKQADALKAKADVQGMLGAEELTLKKGLDVSLLKLGEMQQNYAMNMAEYERLTKTQPKEINLEGRRFYALEDFDENYTIELFQEAAVRNRTEFALAKNKVNDYGVYEVRHDVLQKYPLVERLDVNGLKIENSIYEKEMYNKVMELTKKLLADVRDFRQVGADASKKKFLTRQVFDDLAAAIVTQVELSYRLVEQADADYEENERAIDQVQKAIKRQEKKRRPSAEEQVALLNDKIALLMLEEKSSQILAERAMALRNLYFNAGLSPFSKSMLKGSIKDISVALREAFNQDLVKMLAGTSVQLETRQVLEQTGWAKGDNWLEEVVRESGKYRVKAVTFSPKVRLVQLGAYETPEMAQKDWQRLSRQVSVLKNYQPRIEEAVVYGRKWNRLRIYGASEELNKVCRELIGQNFECLLQ